MKFPFFVIFIVKKYKIMSTFTISACQYVMRPVSNFSEWSQRIIRLLDNAASAQLVLFPELFTLELFTTYKNWHSKEVAAFTDIASFTQDYEALFLKEAKQRGQYIAAGSHLRKIKDKYYNIAHLFSPEGQIFYHYKTHIFPAESAWFTSEGDKMELLTLPFVSLGFNVCYEAEIPECAHTLTQKGAELILCPSATFTEAGFWRVRHCAQARCIENQVYFVHCCLGSVPTLNTPLPQCHARSSILSPCDIVWTNPSGVLQEAALNEEQVITAELNLDILRENRKSGAATTFKDRRRQTSLYKKWL